MKKIMIGIPNTGFIKTELMNWLISQMTNKEYEIHLVTPNNKPHDFNRNVIVQEFMKSDCEWLLQIDCDVIPTTNVLDLTNNNKEVCSALVLTVKDGNIIPLGMRENEQGWINAKLNDGLNEVDAVGTGCLLTHRSVFEKLDKPYFKFEYDNDGMLSAGEDFSFCRKLKQKGIKVYLDTTHKAKHYTSIFI